MNRRRFLARSLGAGSTAMARRTLGAGAFVALTAGGSRPAAAADPAYPIDRLRGAVDAGDIAVLLPGQPDYRRYQRYAAANARVARQPAVRILIRTSAGAAAAVNWARDNSVPFAVRGGGHCYEDFSQSAEVVLDLRPMADVTIAADRASVSVGGGALLGQVYAALAEIDRVVPAGSCPQVGAAGHVLGGGYGLFARKFGLACDSLIGAEIVDAQGRVLTVNDSVEPDLFWALRGAGGGSFGVVTRLDYRTSALEFGTRFTIDWGANGELGIDDAIPVLRAWQAWAPTAPPEMGPILRIHERRGNVNLHCFGISTNIDKSWVRAQLARLADVTDGQIGTPVTQSCGDLVRHFSGGSTLTADLDDTDFFARRYYKGKSDVITQPITAAGARALLRAVVDTGTVNAICDPYGGAIASVAADETAFPHRGGTLFTIQYYAEWENAAETADRLADLARVHAAMRPHASGGAYFNYCDIDLPDPANAYWGVNLPRLRAVKRAYDPANLFRHAQSIAP